MGAAASPPPPLPLRPHARLTAFARPAARRCLQLGHSGMQDSNSPVELAALSRGGINTDALTRQAQPGACVRDPFWCRGSRLQAPRGRQASRAPFAAQAAPVACRLSPRCCAHPLAGAVVLYGVAPSDRYAVVPDSAPGADEVPSVPEAATVPQAGAVPDSKRQKV